MTIIFTLKIILVYFYHLYYGVWGYEVGSRAELRGTLVRANEGLAYIVGLSD